MTKPLNKSHLKIFSDFDGTISQIDTGDLLVDYCIGKAARKALDDKIYSGELSFREGFLAQFAGVNLTWEEACERLHIQDGLDPHFKAFVQWTEKTNIPLVILSSGFEPIIREYFKPNGLAHLEIKANQLDIKDRTWHVKFRDNTPYGHDKAAALKQAKTQGYRTIFIGDGISDIHAAQVADVLFAKKDERLAEFCNQQGIEYHKFEDFGDVLTILNN